MFKILRRKFAFSVTLSTTARLPNLKTLKKVSTLFNSQHYSISVTKQKENLRRPHIGVAYAQTAEIVSKHRQQTIFHSSLSVFLLPVTSSMPLFAGPAKGHLSMSFTLRVRVHTEWCGGSGFYINMSLWYKID
jgi:hypothetical protein